MKLILYIIAVFTSFHCYGSDTCTLDRSDIILTQVYDFVEKTVTYPGYDSSVPRVFVCNLYELDSAKNDLTFSVSNIKNQFELPQLNPTHYLNRDKEYIVFIIEDRYIAYADSLKLLKLDSLSMAKISSERLQDSSKLILYSAPTHVRSIVGCTVYKKDYPATENLPDIYSISRHLYLNTEMILHKDEESFYKWLDNEKQQNSK